jgi:L-threonylcarbamoyladenylate synthase
MQILNKDEYDLRKQELFSKIRNGAVFIYPTDTIYGLGANALNHDAVNKIREAKARCERPFSIIAPSKEWILENCEVNERVEEWLEKLPGPYTLILKLKNKGAVESIVNSGMDTLGVRIPDCWSSEIAKELNVPIVTTSANITGKEFMTSLETLDVDVKNKVDFMINEGEIKGKPSTLIDLTKDEVNIKER